MDKTFRNSRLHGEDTVASVTAIDGVDTGVGATIDLGVADEVMLKDGDTITVVFYNVFVPIDGADTAVLIDDSRVDEAESGIVYSDSMTKIDIAIAVESFTSVGDEEKVLGRVSVTPAEVVGGDSIDLVIEYTSTDGIAEEASDATTADDGMSSHGRIRVALPTGWGPVPDDPSGIDDDFDDEISTVRSVGEPYVQATKDSGVKWARDRDGKERDGVALAVALSTMYDNAG